MMMISKFKFLGSVSRRSFSSKFEITGNLIDGIIVGAFSEVQHTFDQPTVNSFSGICGDDNPLHTNPEFAKNTMFNGTIVHGILVSSLFSTLFGRQLKGSVYVSQSLNFKKPVHVGVPIIARVEILKCEDKRKGTLITCSTTCKVSDTLVVDGEAKVLIFKSEI